MAFNAVADAEVTHPRCQQNVYISTKPCRGLAHRRRIHQVMAALTLETLLAVMEE
jgi:hypothetical protein